MRSIVYKRFLFLENDFLNFFFLQYRSWKNSKQCAWRVKKGIRNNAYSSADQTVLRERGGEKKTGSFLLHAAAAAGAAAAAAAAAATTASVTTAALFSRGEEPSTHDAKSSSIDSKAARAAATPSFCILSCASSAVESMIAWNISRGRTRGSPSSKHPQPFLSSSWRT